MKNRVYLDYAAATPVDSEVAKAMQKAQVSFANPSAQYGSARESKIALEQARKDCAMFLQANSEEVIFTSGATESNNLAILGAARASGKGRIISIATEHTSVREPLKQLEREGYEVIWCKVGADGILSKKDFEKVLSMDTALVSLAYANSEIGNIQPITKIARMIREFEKSNNTKIVFHTDASAAAPFLNCDISRLNVDLLTLGGSKAYGPIGSGALYVRRGTKLQSVQFGGSQERGIRPGTESLVLAVGLAKALKIVQERREKDSDRTDKLMVVLDCILMDEGRLDIVGPSRSRERLPNMRTICFGGVNGEDILAHMDAMGFEVATGAACEAANQDPNQALLALGMSKTQAQGSVRISIGRQTTQAEVEAAAKALVKTLKTLGYKWDNE